MTSPFPHCVVALRGIDFRVLQLPLEVACRLPGALLLAAYR